MGEETKPLNRALVKASIREEIIVNQRQRKARSKYGTSAGIWFDRRVHKAKRSDARFINISVFAFVVGPHFSLVGVHSVVCSLFCCMFHHCVFSIKLFVS